jgi:hypothetical protein
MLEEFSGDKSLLSKADQFVWTVCDLILTGLSFAVLIIDQPTCFTGETMTCQILALC